MKKRTFLASAAALMLAAGGVQAQDPVKVGFIYVGPIGDGGWTYEHDKGRLAVEEAFGDTGQVAGHVAANQVAPGRRDLQRPPGRVADHRRAGTMREGGGEDLALGLAPAAMALQQQERRHAGDHQQEHGEAGVHAAAVRANGGPRRPGQRQKAGDRHRDRNRA